ncbi:MAG: hypothetical protein IPO66_06275 [Rhodanobacteraceae bacterium]|nr:hypothetical protein [Rhodanobacteraceae bacterium]
MLPQGAAGVEWRAARSDSGGGGGGGPRGGGGGEGGGGGGLRGTGGTGQRSPHCVLPCTPKTAHSAPSN